ncbi:MAG: ATP-binding protein, partial [Pygmaiobacter sp.]
MPKKQQIYNDDSISSLKGADRVRLRPGVIFGSDGLEGCEHAVFEILSNAIDEARGGYGDSVIATKYKDGSIEVEDHGRGIPVEFNKNEDRYNWELLFCEMYAGGKYDKGDGNSYGYSLGLNGLGLCATQYASRWMRADVYRDGMHYHLDFEQGKNVGGLKKEETRLKKTGTIIRWLPDTDVFTDIAIPAEYFLDSMKRQSVVNAGVHFIFNDESTAPALTTEFCYENGIADYVAELAGDDAMTPVIYRESETSGRDREDKPAYKVKMSAAFCFSNKRQLLEYYHNSSWLEHGGSPDRAVKTAFVNQIN